MTQTAVIERLEKALKDFKEHFVLIVICFLCCNCNGIGKGEKTDPDTTAVVEEVKQWDNIRVEYPKESFAYYLQHFPRKKGVYLWNGEEKTSPESGAESLDIDVSQNQQCADAIIRLHAEWLWSQKRFADIHYNLTNGFSMDYTKWAEGWRVKVKGNNTEWYKAHETTDYSYKTFRDYLEFVFMYAGTASLDKELVQIGDREIEVGDVFILPGHPGHAVIVVDKTVYPHHKKGDSYRLQFAQSYIPAQTPEIINEPTFNHCKPLSGPWMNVHTGIENPYYFVDHYRFENSNIKTFKQR